MEVAPETLYLVSNANHYNFYSIISPNLVSRDSLFFCTDSHCYQCFIAFLKRRHGNEVVFSRHSGSFFRLFKLIEYCSHYMTLYIQTSINSVFSIDVIMTHIFQSLPALTVLIPGEKQVEIRFSLVLIFYRILFLYHF